MPKTKKPFFRTGASIISAGGGTLEREHDTLENFAYAASIGADVLRTNVIAGNEGRLFCVSDAFLRKAGSQLSPARRTDRTRLLELYDLAYNGVSPRSRNELFPDPGSVLEAFPDARFNFHVFEKTGDALESLCSVVEKLGAVDRLLISAVNGPSTTYVRRRLPGAASAMSLTGLIWFYGLFRSGLMPLARRFAADAILMPERIGNSLFGNGMFIEQARERGLELFVYLDEGPGQLKRLLEAGARGFITGDVMLVKEALEESSPDI